MLSKEFKRPKTISCALCRATISVRKGDKTRFYSHISVDHEVHYDMDFFFAACFMNDQEKDTVVNLLSEKIQNEVLIDDTSIEENEISVCETSNNENEILLNDTSNDEEPPIEKIQTEVIIDDTSNEENEISVFDTTNDENEIFINDSSNDEEPPIEIENEILDNKDEGDMDPSQILSVEITTEETANTANNLEDSENTETETSKEKDEQNVKIKSEKDGSKVECDVCNLLIPKRAIRIHIASKHKGNTAKRNKIQNCLYCDKRVSKGNMNRHIKMMHKRFRKFKKEPGLQKQEETGMDFVKCKTCQKSIKKGSYKRHVIEKHSENKFTCSLCYFSYSRKFTLGKHVEVLHLNDKHLLDVLGKPKFSMLECEVKCPDCDLKFINENCLKIHKDKVPH